MSEYDKGFTTEQISNLFIKQMRQLSVKKENSFEFQYSDIWT